MKRRQMPAALLALGAAAHQAKQKDWSIVGDKRAVTHSLTIDMTDNMRFTPDSITVDEGETVRFVVRNRGRMLHEMVIGTSDELRKHAALMAGFPNMEHDAPYLARVAAGKTGEIIWHFNRPGSFEIACLIPGHYQAGMRGTVTVTPRS